VVAVAAPFACSSELPTRGDKTRVDICHCCRSPAFHVRCHSTLPKPPCGRTGISVTGRHGHHRYRRNLLSGHRKGGAANCGNFMVHTSTRTVALWSLESRGIKGRTSDVPGLANFRKIAMTLIEGFGARMNPNGSLAMKRILWLFGSVALLVLPSCGGYGNTCTVTAAVTPSNTSADHSATAPGNQVQFSIKSTVTGNCPLVADQAGVWSTSDSVNTTISNQPPTQGLATCLNATPSPVTITESGTVRGHTITPATLACN